MRRSALVAGLCAGLLLAMAGSAGAQVNLTPSSANFGKVKARTQSAPIVFTLSRGPIGGSSTYTTQPRVHTADATEFKVLSHTCPSELPTNSSCTISVVFTPTAANPVSGLLLAYPPFSESNVQATMSGQGIVASKGKCKKGKKGAAAAKKKGCKKRK